RQQLVFPVQGERAVDDEQHGEVEQVSRIHLAGVPRTLAGQSQGAGDGDPGVLHGLPGARELAVAPVSAARSTTTLPGFMPSTMAVVTIFGAGRPGTAAVHTITSMLRRCSPSLRCCSARSSSVSWRA